MEDHSKEMIEEYNFLKNKYEALHKILIKMNACISNNVDYKSILGYEPKFSYTLLSDQKRYLGEYLKLLETRAILEGVDLYVL